MTYFTDEQIKKAAAEAVGVSPDELTIDQVNLELDRLAELRFADALAADDDEFWEDMDAGHEDDD
jgi:hypothetical protein